MSTPSSSDLPGYIEASTMFYFDQNLFVITVLFFTILHYATFFLSVLFSFSNVGAHKSYDGTAISIKFYKGGGGGGRILTIARKSNVAR